jgi:hypothetical protein
MADPKHCFVISPIGEAGTEVRKRADQVLRHVIEPAVKLCKYVPVRADGISEPGIITAQVIQHILDDPMVIADLTGANPNVFYELAIRHAIRRPLVQIIQKGEKIPFDVAGMRTITIDHKDLDSVESAKEDIVKQIQAVENKRPDEIDSPITVTVELQSLRQSDNPEQRSLAEFVAALGDVRSNVAALDSKVTALIDNRILSEEELETRERRIFELSNVAHEVGRKIRQMGGLTDTSAITDQLTELRMLAEILESGGSRSFGRRTIRRSST